jgi:hypothetical protein
MLGFWRVCFFIEYLHFIFKVNLAHLKDIISIIIFFVDRLYNLLINSQIDVYYLDQLC